MKFTTLFSVACLGLLGGCELDSSNSHNSTDYKKNLIGTWRSVHPEQEKYLVISRNNFQELNKNQYLDCLASQGDNSFEAKARTLTFEKNGPEIEGYELTENKLTLLDKNSVSTQFERFSEALPTTCSAPDLQERWVSAGDDIPYYLEFSTGKYNPYRILEDYACSTSLPFTYHAHNNKFFMSNLHETWKGSYTVEGEQLTLNWHEAEFFNGEIQALDLQHIYNIENQPINFCSDPSLTKIIESKIGFKHLPDLLENYVPSTIDEKLYFTVSILFDMDSDGTRSSGDLNFLLHYEYSNKMFQSSWQALGAKVLITQRLSPTSYLQAEVTDLNIKIEENSLTLSADAANFKLLNNINTGTPINVSVHAQFDDQTQGDSFPNNISGNNNEQYTTGIDSSYLEDYIDDVSISDSWDITPLVDIHSVEISIIE